MNVAVVDIGTNSVHMLVVRVDAELRYHVIDRAKEMVHLGRGVFETGRLDEAAQERALAALTRFRRLAERRGVQQVIAVATSAVREADNGGAFIQEVYARVGLRPRIVSGAEEARLVFKAVQSQLPLDEKPALVVDLGGGSIEFACGSARALAWTASLKLGVQRLEATALSGGEVLPDGWKALRQRLDVELAPVARRAKAAGVERCLLTSGSAGAVLKLLRGRGDVDEGSDEIPQKALAALAEDLVAMPRVKREGLPGMERSRVDLVVPAVAFYAALAEALGLAALTVSEGGVREGVVQDWIERHGAELQWELTEPNTRRRAVLRFAERMNYDAPHAHHVAKLAVEIFDATKGLHGLDETARELLEYAALVHDVGYLVAERAHHKHTEYLVLHGLEGGFTEVETRMVAAVGRYHRKAEPKGTHPNFAELSGAEKDVVRKTAALLRIADGLDRSHGRAVFGVGFREEEGTAVVEVHAAETPDLEIWAARRKASLFEETFGRKVRFEVVTEPREAGP